MTNPLLLHKTCGRDDFHCVCGKFVMPFGKFKGKNLYSIEYEDGGKNYLRWCAENLDPGRVRDFVESFLVRRGIV